MKRAWSWITDSDRLMWRAARSLTDGWMTPSDRREWRSAHSLADLGELMARWLEGDIASWPGYARNHGPDEETTGLIPTLAALNGAGFLTTDSQPATNAERGYDGQMWMQRAAVTGFIADEDVLERLRTLADRHGLLFTAHHRLPEFSSGEPIPVTLHGDNGDACTVFGARIDDANLRVMWPVIGREAFREVADAWQVTVAAEFGDIGNRMWPLLDRVAAELWLDSLPESDDDQWEGFGGTPHECGFCGAPHYSSGLYCSASCADVALDDDTAAK